MISFKKRRFPLRHIAAITGMVLVFGFLNVATIQHVFAQVDIGPNADWFGGQDTVRYVLEEDGPVTGAGNQTFPIYVFNGSTTNHPTITVTANNSSSGYSRVLAGACLSLDGGCGANSCSIDCSLTIPAANFNYDPTVSGWVAYVYGHLTEGGIHEFNLTASNGATIGYYASKDPNDRSFAVAHTYGAKNFYEYVIPFGSDCTVTPSGQGVSANIYDGDVGDSTIQPVPFRVRIINTTTGQTLYDRTFTGQKVDPATGNPSRARGAIPDYQWAGLQNNAIATFGFTAYPNNKYQFVLDNVASHNTIQFRLPFSSIYSQVDCHYNLTPTTAVTPSISEANTTVTVSPSVTNTGSTASSNTQWQVSRFVVPVGQSYVGAGTSGLTPAAYYGHSLTSLASGNGQSYPVSVTNLTPIDDNVGNQPVGTKICYALSVQAVSDTDSSWAHGEPSCVEIAKKPKVQVWGSDLQATGDVTTSLSPQASGTYGSWDEYGVSAVGTVTGFGSGAAFNSSHGLAGYNSCNVSQLIFTSAGTGTCSGSTQLGHYASAAALPDVATIFPTSSATPVFSALSDAAQRRVETASGNVTIGGGTVAKGNWLVVNAPTATVTITGDINYTAAQLFGVGDIPQVIIIANCINVAGNVQNVDAWLIAVGIPGTNSGCDGVADGGVLNTCSDVAAGGSLSASICSQSLRVNGPVMARHLYLQRTAGGDAPNNVGDPGEVFNLRPDAYLWMAARSSAAGYVQTASTTELPPRF